MIGCSSLRRGGLAGSSASLFVCLATLLSTFSPTFGQEAADSNPRYDLPEAPPTVVQGTMQGVGSQGQAVSGGTPLVSPNLTPTTLADTGSSVSVVTAEQIAQRGQTNVAEILRTLPGLDVVRQGPPGGVTSVFLRGASSSMTKVLIDGIPVNDPSSPNRGYDFSNLSVDNIERIEIIRGPQSVLFGSDAIGGVVNIITRKGKGAVSGRISGLGGSYNTSNTAFNASGSKGPAYYSFGGSLFNTSGFSAAASGTERDAFTLGTFSSRTGWQPSENVDLDVVVRYNQARTDIDSAFGVPTDDLLASTTIQQLSTGVRLHTRGPEGFYEQRTAYYVTQVDRGYRSPDPFFPFFQVYHGNTQQIDSRHTLHLLDTDWLGNDLTGGGLYYTETYDNYDNFGDVVPKTSLDDGAMYVQDQLRVGESWYTTVGGRRDHYNSFGDADTYRITSLYRHPRTQTALRGSIGTGFRAPSLVERFPPFGNPNLQPEKSRGWDMGIEQPWFGGNVVPSVTYFRNDFTNFIQLDANFIPQNIHSARSQGVEFSTLFRIGNQRTLTTNYTFMDAIDTTPTSPTYNTQLIRRPRNKLGVVYNRSFAGGRGNWNVNGSYVDLRNDQVSGRLVQLHSYILVNTAASYNVTKHLQVFGRIDNLLGARYNEVYGYGIAGFSGYGGASLLW